MIWPFRRRSKAQSSKLPLINEDWAPGDLAQCLDGDWPVPGPDKDDIVRVLQVAPGVCNTTGEPAWGLMFAEWPGELYVATSFRKLRPVHDACEAEFKALIQRPATAPAREGQDA